MLSLVSRHAKVALARTVGGELMGGRYGLSVIAVLALMSFAGHAEAEVRFGIASEPCIAFFIINSAVRY
jgi:hypothetical protein